MMYTVIIPIAGHIVFEVEADSQEEARMLAFEKDVKEGDLSYELLEKFHSGNVSYCPQPWKVKVKEVGE